MSESEEEQLRRRRLQRELDIWADRVERELLEDRIAPSEVLQRLWTERFRHAGANLKAMHDHLMDVEMPRLKRPQERVGLIRIRAADIGERERVALGEGFRMVLEGQEGSGPDAPVASALRLWVERARDEVDLLAESFDKGEAGEELVRGAEAQLAELEEISERVLGPWDLPPPPEEPPAAGLVQVGQLEIDMDSGRTRLGDRETHLTLTERRILAMAAVNPDRAVTMPALQRGAGIALPSDAARRGSLPVHVRNMRRQLGEPEVLTTVVGVGFQLGPAAVRSEPAGREAREARRLDRLGRPEVKPEVSPGRKPTPGLDRERDD